MQVNSFKPQMYSLNKANNAENPVPTKVQPQSSDAVSFKGSGIKTGLFAASAYAMILTPIAYMLYTSTNQPTVNNIAMALKDLKQNEIPIEDIFIGDKEKDGYMEIIANTDSGKIIYDPQSSIKTEEFADSDNTKVSKYAPLSLNKLQRVLLNKTFLDDNQLLKIASAALEDIKSKGISLKDVALKDEDLDGKVDLVIKSGENEKTTYDIAKNQKRESYTAPTGKPYTNFYSLISNQTE